MDNFTHHASTCFSLSSIGKEGQVSAHARFGAQHVVAKLAEPAAFPAKPMKLEGHRSVRSKLAS